MENKLLKKLGVKPGHTLRTLNAPQNISEIFGEIPDGVQHITKAQAANVAIVFAQDSKAMQRGLEALKPQLQPDTILWIAYPKKGSGMVTDISMMTFGTITEPLGFEPVASAAIDDSWSALRLRPLGQKKASGTANNDIEKGVLSAYIDVKNRIVTLPPDLAEALKHSAAAQDYYNSLAYSHRKEYVLWIITAKQQKTREARIEKMLAMLQEGRKNPADKTG